MMRSMYAGVTGLRNHQVRMDAIGNNIANVNTVGYKASRVTFQDALNQTMRGASAPSPDGSRGGINPMQIGLGMNVASIDVLHSQGNLQNTGQITDLALQGDGFFILSDGSQNYYTRAGNFIKEKDGRIVNSSNGLMVRGWMADSSGNINTNTTTTTIQLPVGQTIQPRATTEIDFGGNIHPAIDGLLGYGTLNVDDGTGNSCVIEFEIVPTGFYEYTWTATIVRGGGELLGATGTISVDPATNNITTVTGGPFGVDWDGNGVLDATDAAINLPVAGAADGSYFEYVAGGTQATGTFHPAQPINTTSRVFDSLGNSHTFVTTVTKTGINTWSWTTTDEGGLPLAGNTGVLTFDSSGRLISATGGPITCTPIGAAPMTVNPDFGQLTQQAKNRPLDPDAVYISPDSMETYSQDGYAMGELNGFTIGKTGIIVGTFSNGLTQSLAQIAIASFTNPGGLIRVGDTMFSESNNSGDVRIGVAGTGDRGLVTPGAIEMSNVDLSAEFTDMIVTERGFQSNSRVITTSDEMLQELVNLKR